MLAQRDNTPAATPEPEATPETEPEYTFGEEATKVLSDKWEGFTGSVATGVAALPFVGDDAARAQARADVWQGVKDQYNGIRALSPPNIFDFGESAIGLATGDPEQAAAVSRKWDETQNTWGNVADNAVNSWNEAEQRNGTLGALEMSTFAIGSELLGGKGTGVVGKAGRLGHAAEDAAGAARRVDEIPGNGSTVNSALHAKHVDELAALNRQGLLSELSQNGIKHNPENIVDIRKMQDGKIAFLETGNKQAGLEHILVQHQQDFANVGIHADQIPDAVMTAVTQGKVIGYQGKNQGRTIYDVVFNDTRHQISVTVSDNGFVVGANPQSRLSPYIME